MVNAGLPPMEIMKVTGHTQISTFARYINPTNQTLVSIADTLSTYVKINTRKANRIAQSTINK